MPGEPGFPPRWHAVVRAHHRNTLGLVVAQTGECLRIQDDEKELVPGRAFRPVRPKDLPRLDLGARWFVGVLLCPGDTTRDLAAWAVKLSKPDTNRIRFYFLHGTNLREAFGAWEAAGLPDRPKFEVAGFRSFHHLYGRHHGDQVFRDATRPTP